MRRFTWFFLFFFVLYPGSLRAAQDSTPLPSLETDDAVLTSIFQESVTVALDSIQTAQDGSHYLSAGPKYANPPRTYYRDSYWTSGLILMIDPSIVREQILRLASGVEADGSVPSVVSIDSDLTIPLWIDHHDSGPFFIMMVYDYIRWTGDTSILNSFIGNRTIFVIMEDILTHLRSLDTDGNFLPEKPPNSLQDWLDSIPRGGEVLYNELLYYRALRNMVELAELRGYTTHALVFHRVSLLARYQINKQFWNEATGSFYERCEKHICVDRLTNESSLAILYDVIYPEHRKQFFETLTQLETDWGVLNAVPAYEGFTQTSYQNATDWPVLDGMNAGARLKYGNTDWYVPLTTWWISFDKDRKSGEMLPEFVSPIDKSTGLSQAWSVNPIVSFIRYGIGLDPALDGSYTIRSSPTTDVVLKHVLVRDQYITIQTKQKKISAH